MNFSQNPINRSLLRLCAILLFLVATAILHQPDPANGSFFDPRIYSILPFDYLRQCPAASIFLFHGQPPLSNLIMAGLLRFPEPKIAGLCLTLFLGCAATWFLSDALLRYRRGGWALLVILLSPVWAGFLDYLNTDGLALFLGSVFVWGLASARPATACGALLGLSWLRPQFSFLIVVPLILWLGRHKPWMALLMSLVCLSVPLKNYCLYGFFGQTSWGGYNLTRGTPAHPLWWGGWRTAVPGEAAASSVIRHPSLLENPKRGTRELNWNQVYQIEASRQLVPKAMEWRKQNLGDVLRNTGFYFCRMGHSCSGMLGIGSKGPAKAWYGVSDRLGTPLFFRKWFAFQRIRLAAWSSTDPRGDEGFVLGGFLVVASLLVGIWAVFRNPVLIPAGLLVGWVVATGTLTDGEEAYRYWAELTPLAGLLWCGIFKPDIPQTKPKAEDNQQPLHNPKETEGDRI